jgi:putative DNA primase/helicase
MFAAEREGILAWGIAGAMRWFAGGLGTPQAVSEATKTYRTDQDIVQQFLDECCEAGPEFKAGKTCTYAAWQGWLRENDEADYLKKSKNWLTYRLRNLGFNTGGRGNQSYCGFRMSL